MNAINFKNIIEENGKTIEQNNLEKQHKYSVGQLVEVKYDEWGCDGSCEIVHARLWIVSLDRDCDGTPLYSLSKTPRHRWDEIQVIISDKKTSYGLKEDISQSIFYKVKSGFLEERLTLVEVTEDLKKGVGALKWENDKI